jgi:putative endonuclease
VLSSRRLSPGSNVRQTPCAYWETTLRAYWTYILASKPRGTLYIGVTNGLVFRVEQHRTGKGSGYTRKYKVHQLVWFQEFADVREAIQREKTMKEWPRVWKINLIESTNPNWIDLYPSLPGVSPPLTKGMRG